MSGPAPQVAATSIGTSTEDRKETSSTASPGPDGASGPTTPGHLDVATRLRLHRRRALPTPSRVRSQPGPALALRIAIASRSRARSSREEKLAPPERRPVNGVDISGSPAARLRDDAVHPDELINSRASQEPSPRVTSSTRSARASARSSSARRRPARRCSSSTSPTGSRRTIPRSC